MTQETMKIIVIPLPAGDYLENYQERLDVKSLINLLNNDRQYFYSPPDGHYCFFVLSDTQLSNPEYSLLMEIFMIGIDTLPSWKESFKDIYTNIKFEESFLPIFNADDLFYRPISILYNSKLIDIHYNDNIREENTK